MIQRNCKVDSDKKYNSLTAAVYIFDVRSGKVLQLVNICLWSYTRHEFHQQSVMVEIEIVKSQHFLVRLERGEIAQNPHKPNSIDREKDSRDERSFHHHRGYGLSREVTADLFNP